jgi:hypothetical protein
VIDRETGRTQRLHQLPIHPETFLRELADVIEESRTDGYADRLLGSMQHVTVIDYRAWAGREDELGKRDSAVTSQLGWGPENKPFEWLASYRRMRDRRASFGSLAPLAIFPLDPQDIADLMLGYLELRTMLRGDLLEQAFTAHDISADVTFGDDADEVFLRVARGVVSLAIPPSLRERLLFELLTPDSAIALADGMLDLLAADQHLAEDVLPATDESGIWA